MGISVKGGWVMVALFAVLEPETKANKVPSNAPSLSCVRA